MRLKRSNAGARVCALASFVVLSATLLTVTPAALALPSGRVYEMVSPPYKGGYGVGGLDGTINAVAPDGESVAFFSAGEFAGTPSGSAALDYIARRGESGWSTAALIIPPTVLATTGSPDVSSSLNTIIDSGTPGSSYLAAFTTGTEDEFWLHGTNSPDTVTNWELAGMSFKALSNLPFSLGTVGASANLCRLFFTTRALLPEAVGTFNGDANIYELDSGCKGEPRVLRLVAVRNALGPSGEPATFVPSCPPELGTINGNTNKFNAISADGKEVFFTTNTGGGCNGSYQLFVRLDAKKTLEVSKPVSEAASCGEEVPCPGAAARSTAVFVGASRDGSRVFFTSNERLSETDTDGTSDLYMATLGCPPANEGCEVAAWQVKSLVQVSRAPAAGEAAEVQGVVRVSPDGSRVYFVARGVLGEDVAAEGRAPSKGADNLYVYDSATGKTGFVADLCSGPRSSGMVEDLRCPPELEGAGGDKNDSRLWSDYFETEDQTAGLDGRFLVFSSYGQLTGDDTDTAKDVYRYDAETGVLLRVSTGEAGYDANGNNSAFDATIAAGYKGGSVVQQYEMDNRAISEDGSRIVFRTSEPLSPEAVNGVEDAYEWHLEPGAKQGAVSLLSGGSAEQPVPSVVISSTGNDIFFATSQGLVPQDTDGALDIYDARLHGGFPEAPASPQPCAGDACQGPLTNPAPLLVPGSVAQAPGENLAAPAAGPATKPKPKNKAKPKCKRGYTRAKRGGCVKVKKAGRHGARQGSSGRGGS